MNIQKMRQDSRKAYVEVLEVLNHMEPKYVEKIPSKLIDLFKINASKEYIFKLNNNIPFEEQELMQSTINILAMLNYNYWCEDEEHKKYLLNKYNENEIKYQIMLREKYSQDNLFKKESTNFENIPQDVSNIFNNIPQKYSEPKWYENC